MTCMHIVPVPKCMLNKTPAEQRSLSLGMLSRRGLKKKERSVANFMFIHDFNRFVIQKNVLINVQELNIPN